MISVKLEDLPHKVGGFTVQDEADNYTIVLNARLNDEQRYKSYKHEIKHIKENDFDYKEDVGVIELERHGKSDER